MLMVTGIQIDILFGGLHRCAIKEPEFAFSQSSLLSVGLKQIRTLLYVYTGSATIAEQSY
jgi:hypothetical protein